jgi:hypothetical protein
VNFEEVDIKKTNRPFAGNINARKNKKQTKATERGGVE